MDFQQVIFVVGIVFGLLVAGGIVGWYVTRMRFMRKWDVLVPELRKDAIMRSRANLGGKFTEALSMYFPDFPFSPTEMRWVGGSPIDYIVFKGMDNDKIEQVVFLEIKSGKSQLSPREKQIKEVIEKKGVAWRMYRAPEQLTRGENADSH